MSISDQDELHNAGCSDFESEQPVLSSVDSTKTQRLRVNVCPIFADPTLNRDPGYCLYLPLQYQPLQGQFKGSRTLERGRIL